MKKRIISFILCLTCIFGVSCSVPLTSESLEESLIESVEESLIESEEESLTESKEESLIESEKESLIESEGESLSENEQESSNENVEQEVVPDPTEMQYDYTPLDESVRAEIEAYLGHHLRNYCYYGEFEGKNVFAFRTPLASIDVLQMGAFSLFSNTILRLLIWDGEKIVNYQQNCDIFSFETSKEIAFIHLNHMLNGCFGFCAFENNKETKKSNYIDRWGYMVGELADDYAPIEFRLGEYEMKGYLAEQTPIISGDMVFLLGDVEGLPDYPQNTRAIFITIKNLLGFEEEYYFYGTFADIMDMYEITEDMWLDSYDGFTKTENFDLEKAKSLKYCVPIYVADTVEFDHEICLVLDNDKDKNSYILIMDINEETGKKYVSGVYQYQWVREHQE